MSSIIAPAVQVIPSDVTLTEMDGLAVRLSDVWHGRRGPTKSKTSAIALAERMAHSHDAFVVRREDDIWAVRMILDAATGQPLVVRRQALVEVS